MKRLSIVLFVLVTTVATAQEKINFKISFQPKKTYTTTMQMTHSAEINFTGGEEFMRQLEASGTSLPLRLTGTSDTQVTTTTGKRNRKDKTIPARIVYDRMSNTQVLNGQERSEENPIRGAVIEGHYDDNARLSIDTIISNRIDNATRATLRATIDNLQQVVAFPAHPLGVGDTFDQEVPLEIPVAGMQPIRAVIRSTFTLTGFTRQQANFDVVQTVELAMEVAEGKETRITGSGNGVAEFDRKRGTLSRYETDMTMSMEMDLGDMQVLAEMTSHVNQRIEVGR